MINIYYSNHVCYLTFNRKEKLNALNKEMMSQLKTQLKKLNTSNETKVIVLMGEGEKAFVAGADIGEFLELSDEREASAYSSEGQSVFNLIEEIDKPVIAAINGYALGGGLELALACDFRISSEKALFGMPEISLGLYPGYGGAQRLPRLVGKGKAFYLMMSGKTITATEAERWGLVDFIYPSVSFKRKVEDIAQEISRHSTTALGYLKKSVNNGLESNINDALKLDSVMVGKLMISEETRNNAERFLN